MSFVTVFTASTMGFVLLAPLLMITVLVLTQAQLNRSRVQVVEVEPEAPTSAHDVSRAA